MILKITRVSAGNYLTIVHDETYVIAVGDDGTWTTTKSSTGKQVGRRQITKKAAVSALEVLARQPQDRTVSDTLKMFRRGEIKKHTQLTIEGIRGKCSFISYTRKDDGSEWIDVITSKLQSRTVRPSRIKTVHRGA